MNTKHDKRRLAILTFVPTLLMMALFTLACGGAEPAAQNLQQPSESMTDASSGRTSSTVRQDAPANASGSSSNAALADTMSPAKSAETMIADLANLSGDITIDGSSTVFPVSEAVAEEFGILTNGKVRVTVGLSGSGGGFKKFCAGETDISNASRPIKQKEVDLCADSGIEYVEVPVAIDGLSVMTHPSNGYIDCMTIDELNRLWGPEAEGAIMKWDQVRDGWPAEDVRLYGPGVDSGTFDYFTEVVNGESQSSRGDFTASEDDNVLVQGIAGDEHSLGFFGYAYYIENQDKLKLVGIDGGEGCVTPSNDTIEDGSYQPLARPLFIYIKKESLANPHFEAFAKYYLSEEGGQALVRDVGYLPYSGEVYQLAQDRVERGLTGTLFGGGSPQKGPIARVLADNR